VNPYEAPNSRPVQAESQGTVRWVPSLWLIAYLAFPSALPLAFLVLVYTTAARAAIYLGHWPTYGHPDPKDLPEHFRPPEFLKWLIPLGSIPLVVGLIVLVVKQLVPLRWRLAISLWILVGLWAWSIVLLFLDPAGVLEWLVD
jgi:hypothetical protein